MSSLPQRRYTPEEYLAMERKAEFKSEYDSGEIVAMAGASRAHNRIALNIGTALTVQLQGTPCEPFVNDMRVKINTAGKYNYPDVVVACGELQFEDPEVDTLLNPVVIVEVLSPSTELRDRGEKFLQYHWLDSLTDYVLVSQDKVLVERFSRHPDGDWRYSRLLDINDVLALPVIGASIPVTEIYARVRFAPSGRVEDGDDNSEE